MLLLDFTNQLCSHVFSLPSPGSPSRTERCCASKLLGLPCRRLHRCRVRRRIPKGTARSCFFDLIPPPTGRSSFSEPANGVPDSQVVAYLYNPTSRDVKYLVALGSAHFERQRLAGVKKKNTHTHRRKKREKKWIFFLGHLE